MKIKRSTWKSKSPVTVSTGHNKGHTYFLLNWFINTLFTKFKGGYFNRKREH